MRRAEAGFALVIVLLVLALAGVLGAEFAYSMRLEATAVRSYKEQLVGGHLAEAAVAQAIREIVAEAAFAALDDDGILTFYTAERLPRPRLDRDGVDLGPGRYRYRISDEEARLNVNTSGPDRLDRLLEAMDLSKRARDVVVDSILDWRDPNDEHRLNGAESDDYYLRLDIPYRARNANLESVDELRQVRGVTAELFEAQDDRPGLVDLLTVKTPGQVNINTASPLVLKALGLSDAEIGLIVQARRLGPYAALPSQFGGRGLAAGTRTFRIEAEGFVGDRVAARVTAIVQKRTEGGRAAIAFLEWSGPR